MPIKVKYFALMQSVPSYLLLTLPSPVTHPTIKGFIIAPFTHLLSPETVVPSRVCKTDKGALIFMQPMQHGFIDFYRYHQEWVQKAENQGNVVDCLESLFQARPDIEENFILASLTDLTH